MLAGVRVFLDHAVTVPDYEQSFRRVRVNVTQCEAHIDIVLALFQWHGCPYVVYSLHLDRYVADWC